MPPCALVLSQFEPVVRRFDTVGRGLEHWCQ